MRRLICFFRSESVDLRMMMSIKVIMLQLGLTAFYFLRLLIQFIIRGNNTFGMGVWYGTVVWYGIFVPYYIPNHRTIPGFTVCLTFGTYSQFTPKDKVTLFKVRYLFCSKGRHELLPLLIESILSFRYGVIYGDFITLN